MSDFDKILKLLSEEKNKQIEINSKLEVLNEEIQAVTF